MDRRVKGAPKLTKKEREEIVAKHQAGMSLRELALEYKCSHERVRQIARLEADDYIPSQAARIFREKHVTKFIQLVVTGVTPEIAAGSLGLNKDGYEMLLSYDADFAMAVETARNASLVESELVIASEAKTNWKAALERLTRAKESRDHWKSAETKGGTQINIVMGWERDEKVIEHDDE